MWDYIIYADTKCGRIYIRYDDNHNGYVITYDINEATLFSDTLKLCDILLHFYYQTGVDFRLERIAKE